ncbi:MAG: phosphoglycolate phosphatase [Pseudomonadales bacterium]
MSWQGQYAGYLFDLDGTLVDTAPDLNRAQNAALLAHGYTGADEAETRLWVGHGARVLLEKAIAAQTRRSPETSELDAMHQHFLSHYAANIAHASTPYPEVVNTLEALATRGAQLAVVTNKPEGLSRRLLEALELSDRFHLLVGGDSAAQPKPAADPAAMACEQLGLSAQEVLFVGDSGADVGCARAFGCAVVCVSYGYNQGIDPSALGADGVIDSFAALL